jgi:hypothetical protein
MLVVPQVDYCRDGIVSLDFSFHPYAVASLSVHRSKHRKIIDDYYRTYPGSEKAFAHDTFTLDNSLLKLKILKLNLPVQLIRALSSGKIYSEGCKVIQKTNQTITYDITGTDNELVLSHSFVRFLMSLGDYPLKTMLNLGLIDELTYLIVESTDDSITDMPPLIREKDRGYLRLIRKTDGFLTFDGWGKVLGLTREGAYRSLSRLGDAGLVSLVKHESGEGCKVVLMDQGVSAIR